MLKSILMFRIPFYRALFSQVTFLNVTFETQFFNFSFMYTCIAFYGSEMVEVDDNDVQCAKLQLQHRANMAVRTNDKPPSVQ